MNLDTYLKEAWTANPPEGTPGRETDWLEFCDLVLSSGKLLIADAQFIPSLEDGVLVELPPGTYTLEARVMDYGSDKRIARLRALLPGSTVVLRRLIDKTWTDTAQTGVCDYELFAAAWGAHEQSAWEVIEPVLTSGWTHGVAVLDQTTGAVMPFVGSGFGDGEFPVFELQSDSQRVGVEIEFIKPGTPYPF
jgi:hypothetical protein